MFVFPHGSTDALSITDAGHLCVRVIRLMMVSRSLLCPSGNDEKILTIVMEQTQNPGSSEGEYNFSPV